MTLELIHHLTPADSGVPEFATVEREAIGKIEVLYVGTVEEAVINAINWSFDNGLRLFSKTVKHVNAPDMSLITKTPVMVIGV